VAELAGRLREIFTLRLKLQTHAEPYPGLAEDLAALLPADFLRTTPYERLAHLPRYLKGRLARADRWKRDPAKDAGRAKELEPFVQATRKSGERAGELRWLVEEFRVSLFAQELGTAEPVSAVRLRNALKDVQDAGRTDLAAAAPTTRPLALPSKNRRVLKSLSALGHLQP
jgi:ATP-dependent helicase HrpA